MSTVTEVATWMATHARTKGLRQRTAAAEISKLFGPEFVYRNRNGRLSIAKTVLCEFKKMTSSEVVWAKRTRTWRLRTPQDPADARQVRR